MAGTLELRKGEVPQQVISNKVMIAGAGALFAVLLAAKATKKVEASKIQVFGLRAVFEGRPPRSGSDFGVPDEGHRVVSDLIDLLFDVLAALPIDVERTLVLVRLHKNG